MKGGPRKRYMDHIRPNRERSGGQYRDGRPHQRWVTRELDRVWSKSMEIHVPCGTTDASERRAVSCVSF